MENLSAFANEQDIARSATDPSPARRSCIIDATIPTPTRFRSAYQVVSLLVPRNERAETGESSCASPLIAAPIKFRKRMVRTTIPAHARAGMVRNIFRFATDVPTLPIPEMPPPRSTHRFIGRDIQAMPHHADVAIEI